MSGLDSRCRICIEFFLLFFRFNRSSSHFLKQGLKPVKTMVSIRVHLLYFGLLYFLTLVNGDDYLPVDRRNPLLTHWTEENEMRERIGEYADKKFAQHYHHFANISENDTKKIPKRIEIVRRKREALVGSIATAVVTGMIGENLLLINIYTPKNQFLNT